MYRDTWDPRSKGQGFLQPLGACILLTAMYRLSRALRTVTLQPQDTEVASLALVSPAGYCSQLHAQVLTE